MLHLDVIWTRFFLNLKTKYRSEEIIGNRKQKYKTHIFLFTKNFFYFHFVKQIKENDLTLYCKYGKFRNTALNNIKKHLCWKMAKIPPRRKLVKSMSVWYLINVLYMIVWWNKRDGKKHCFYRRKNNFTHQKDF